MSDPFGIEFKKYKRRQPPPDFTDVIDFDEKFENFFAVHEVASDSSQEEVCSNLNLIPSHQWRAFHSIEFPGLFVVRNPFTPLGQEYWIRRCLVDFPNKPSMTNLDRLMNTDDIFERSQSDLEGGPLSQLRWVTLGYHYDWNTKTYSEDRRSEFPSDLGRLCAFILDQVGFKQFNAEAAIVNYYHMDSTLSGHVDYSELDHDAPLISISLGQDAVFLLGGLTKDVKPTAMYLRSGDCVIMSGQSRLAYHAVPRILPARVRTWAGVNEAEADPDWAVCEQYVGRSRLNMNVRQVYPR